MNLVDQLLKADVKKAKELETGEYQSRRLAKILESEEKTLPVKIREIKSRRMNDIVSYQFKNNGDMDFSKTYDAALMVCVEGYHELGGNGMITKMKNEIEELHLKKKEA